MACRSELSRLSGPTAAVAGQARERAPRQMPPLLLVEPAASAGVPQVQVVEVVEVEITHERQSVRGKHGSQHAALLPDVVPQHGVSLYIIHIAGLGHLPLLQLHDGEPYPHKGGNDHHQNDKW